MNVIAELHKPLLHALDQVVFAPLIQGCRTPLLVAFALAPQRVGQVILALDGLQPDRGHEVLWVIRDCRSGEVLLARSLLSATQGDLVALLREVKAVLPVLVSGIISDGQDTIRTAGAAVFPEAPYQLGHVHYLREATKPIAEADRHAKKELQQQVRGVRPLERALEGRKDAEATAIHG